MSFDSLPFPVADGRTIGPPSINPLDMRLLCATPRLVSDVSAWIQHIPFAFALVEMLRPRRIVELGTHKGDSYCALCQAVDMLRLDAYCTAVDTWVGDLQCGTYNEHIFADLRAHHDPLYEKFSTLLRATFDDAVGQFKDGSIDLLHLDGLHHYDAVRHDFDTWRPKLSDRAVVILHDTNVHHGDFGVHRLWKELQPHFPNFEFEHGSGLGVLAVGAHLPPGLAKFLAAANHSAVAIRQLFSALGQRLELSRGIALLADDVVEQETRANAWRSFANQPLRQVLPDDLVSTGLLNVGQHDTKVLIDRLHEASLDHIDDMITIVTDNRNLRRIFSQLRLQLADESTRPSDSVAAHTKADSGLLRKWINKLPGMGRFRIMRMRWHLASENRRRKISNSSPIVPPG